MEWQANSIMATGSSLTQNTTKQPVDSHKHRFHVKDGLDLDGAWRANDGQFENRNSGITTRMSWILMTFESMSNMQMIFQDGFGMYSPERANWFHGQPHSLQREQSYADHCSTQGLMARSSRTLSRMMPERIHASDRTDWLKVMQQLLQLLARDPW